MTAFGLVVHDHQFAALFEPQVHLPADHQIFHRHQEIEFPLDARGPRGAPAQCALAEDAGQPRGLRIGIRDRLPRQQRVDLGPEFRRRQVRRLCAGPPR